MRNKRALLVAIVCLMLPGAYPMGAYAQDYPNQPIKLVIPNPPGGPGDIIARAFTEKAAQTVGKPFVFEYRPGASTTIGTAFAGKAEPDGYTILGLPSSGVGATAIKKQLRYSLETDFSPIAGIGSVPLVLVVRAGLNVKTMTDFTAAVRTGKLTFGSAGVGTIGHLSALLLMNEIEGSATHVPFKGNPEVTQALLGGQVDFSILSVTDAAPYAASKDVALVATTADRRLSDLPNVPTMIELGLPHVDAKLWYACLAPSKTPADRIARLYTAFTEAGKALAAEKQLESLGFNVEMRDPDAWQP
ncbi:MAG: tripartite tricarboxylate transporter substrate binding protein [Xanthobacteraceae bacterium]